MHIKVLTSETDVRGQNNPELEKKHRRRWCRVDEKLLINIINKYDGGQLKNVTVDYKTNVKITRHDAWERVT